MRQQHVEYLAICYGANTLHATEEAAIDAAAKHEPGFVMKFTTTADAKTVERVWPTAGREREVTMNQQHVEYQVLRLGGGTKHTTETAAIDEAAKHNPGFVMKVTTTARRKTVQRVWPTVGPAIDDNSTLYK